MLHFFISFLLSVVAGVTADYIFKWLTDKKGGNKEE